MASVPLTFNQKEEVLLKSDVKDFFLLRHEIKTK